MNLKKRLKLSSSSRESNILLIAITKGTDGNGTDHLKKTTDLLACHIYFSVRISILQDVSRLDP